MGWTKGRPRPNRAPPRFAKTGPDVIARWVELIKAAVVARNASRIPGMTEDNFYRFAGSMTLIGPPDDPDTLNLFDLFCQMLLSRKTSPQPNWIAEQVRDQHPLKKGRIFYFEANHSFLPVTREGLLKVGAALKAAGRIEDVEKATFNVEAFVKVALALPDPERLVEVSEKFGLDQWKIGTVFNQDTVDKWTGVYRGVLGMLADPEYVKEWVDKIRTIR